MKPKKAMVERIATITPIATRNTPFTISLMMPQRMPNTPKAVRIIKPHIANPMCCAICLKFAVAVISSLFLIFLFLMRIQELRELSFKPVSYTHLVHVIFPAEVRYVDLGSPDLIAGKADGAENIIRVKATVRNFPNETNMSVITEDGSFYTFSAPIIGA